MSNCKNLKKVVLIANAGSGNYANVFSNDTALIEVIISDNVTNLYGSCFSNSGALRKVKMSKNITSISQSCFNNCFVISYYDFSASTSVPTLGNSAIVTSTNTKIIVPDDLYSSWVSSWSSYSSNIISKSDWDALNS